MRRRSDVGLALVALAVLSACAADEPVVEADGSCADAEGAELCTWASTQGEAIIEAGVTLAMASVEGAPVDAPMAWPPATVAVVQMPAASSQRGGLDHMTMYWEPMGHTPATYQVPHFDFHFYLVPDSRRQAIDCADTSKPSTLPEGYILPDETLPPEVAEMIGVDVLVGICVPGMGMHAVPAAEASATEAFEATMIVGYYGGEPIFVEPMISQTKLLQRRSFEIPVPAVEGLAARQPTTFRADYVEAEDAYRFTFAGFAATE
jgi:hypothetical protein